MTPADVEQALHLTRLRVEYAHGKVVAGDADFAVDLNVRRVAAQVITSRHPELPAIQGWAAIDRIVAVLGERRAA